MVDSLNGSWPKIRWMRLSRKTSSNSANVWRPVKAIVLNPLCFPSCKATPGSKLLLSTGGSCAKSPIKTTPIPPNPPRSFGIVCALPKRSNHSTFPTCSSRLLINSKEAAPTVEISSITRSSTSRSTHTRSSSELPFKSSAPLSAFV